MAAYQIKKVCEVANVYSGYAFRSKDLGDDGFPVLKIKNVNNKKVSKDCEQFLPKELVTSKLQKFFLKPDDVLVAMTGQGSLGRIGKMIEQDRPYLVNQRVGIVRPKEIDGTEDFLFSVLALDTYEEQLFTIGAGAGQPNVSAADIGGLEIPYPEYEVRKKIGNVRKSYDNLIENNNRRIAILEDMAQSLYREWFVKFRYPGHENQTLIDSPLGPIPEGWEVENLSDIAKVNPEGITKKNAPKSIHYIDIKSVSTGSIDETKEMLFAEAPSRARRKVRHGDVIWATVRPNRKQYSFIARPRDNTVASTGFAVLRAHNVSPEYLYYAVTTDDFSAYLVNHATGSAYPAVNAKDFEGALVLKPSDDLLTKFDALVSPCVTEIEVLKNKNANLKQQRDMLLPKLISGKIKL